MRAAYGAGAAVFAIAVFVLLHVVAYSLMVPGLSPTAASLILLAVDVVAAGALAYFALGNAPDLIEQEALTIRQQAVIEMRRSMTAVSLAGELAGVVLRRPRTVTVVRPRSSVRVAGELAARLMSKR